MLMFFIYHLQILLVLGPLLGLDNDALQRPENELREFSGVLNHGGELEVLDDLGHQHLLFILGELLADALGDEDKKRKGGAKI